MHINVDIWSDIVCPFCYIGREHLLKAQARLQEAHPEATVKLRWRSFELDASAPAYDPRPLIEILSAKYRQSEAQTHAMIQRMEQMARAAGLPIDTSAMKRINTFDMHRLLHLAHTTDQQDALKARLMKAYFAEGENLSTRDTLIRLSTEVGLDANTVKKVLDSEQYADAVRADQQQANAYTIQGVPFFVFNEEHAVSGAQPVEILFEALKTSA